jgi:hypothetical protein
VGIFYISTSARLSFLTAVTQLYVHALPFQPVLMLNTIMQGFEGFLTSKSASARNKNRVFRVEDRAFSLSSYTSPATRELQQTSQQIFNGVGQYPYQGIGAGHLGKGQY